MGTGEINTAQSSEEAEKSEGTDICWEHRGSGRLSNCSKVMQQSVEEGRT